MFVDKLMQVEGGPETLDTAGLGLASMPPDSTGAVEQLSIPTRLEAVGQPATRRSRSARAGIRRRQGWTMIVLDSLGVLAASAAWYFMAGRPAGVDLALLAGLPVFWIAVAAAYGTYSLPVLDPAARRLERLGSTFLFVTAGIALPSWAADLRPSRILLLGGVGATLVGSAIARYVAVHLIERQQRNGRSRTRIVVAGPERVAASVIKAITLDERAGAEVIGVCVPGGGEADAHLPLLDAFDLPVTAELDDVLDVVRTLGADVLVLSADGDLMPERVRWLSWQLEGSGVEVVIAPGLVEVADRRVSVQPLGGMPLLHVATPRYDSPTRTIKNGLERLVALVAVLLLAPLLLTIAALVRCTSSGPALFRQVRVGRDGRHFTIYKFRSMYLDAEQRKAELAHANESADGLLFKIRNDPRITRVGAKLRKYSLDELPQLINVALGSMALVGPRPPLPDEVAQYSEEVRRRLLVKPGLTGLWQVSGRSDLSWEESVRLDLRYVENWSVREDLRILGKTVGAVAGASGSY